MIDATRLPDSNDGYRQVAFTPRVQLVRGLWKCGACGTLQADYDIAGENKLSCGPCPGCGEVGEIFEVLELIGLVDGVEVNLKDDFLRLVQAERSDAD